MEIKVLLALALLRVGIKSGIGAPDAHLSGTSHITTALIVELC